MTIVPTEPEMPAGPSVDPIADGAFNLPPSERARRSAVAIGMIAAALLLHFGVMTALFVNWRGLISPEARPMQVRLVPAPPRQEAAPPKPPAPPKQEAEKPKPPEPPKPEPEKPKPPEPPKQEAEVKPRESGPDEKTEAAKKDKPENNLPIEVPVQTEAVKQPPPPKPPPPVEAPKPTPPKALAKESAIGKGEMKPVEALPPALQPQREAAPPMRNLEIRLPSPGGGSGDADLAGDPYLNKMRGLLEQHRVYPPDEAFVGAPSRTAIYSLVIEPTGQLVAVTQLSSTGVPRLDEVGLQMIYGTSPFPPLPPDYPQIRTKIVVYIPVFPRGGGAGSER